MYGIVIVVSIILLAAARSVHATSVANEAKKRKREQADQNT